MKVNFLLDNLPSWVLFVLTIVITIIVFEGGFRLGKSRENSKSERRAPIPSIMGATLGLLAFILAFTFSLAATRFQERRQLVLEDVNAIETTYRSADYLADPQRTHIRDLLLEYVKIRNPNLQRDELSQLLIRTEQLQDQLWVEALVVAKNHPDSVMAGLFIESLNQVFDIHSRRVTVGVQMRIPGIIWVILYFVTTLSMLALGYYCGLLKARSWPINFAMILIFSGVIFLIADLDSAETGILKVSQQPMIDLLNKMKGS